MNRLLIWHQWRGLDSLLFVNFDCFLLHHLLELWQKWSGYCLPYSLAYDHIHYLCYAIFFYQFVDCLLCKFLLFLWENISKGFMNDVDTKIIMKWPTYLFGQKMKTELKNYQFPLWCLPFCLHQLSVIKLSRQKYTTIIWYTTARMRFLFYERKHIYCMKTTRFFDRETAFGIKHS